MSNLISALFHWFVVHVEARKRKRAEMTAALRPKAPEVRHEPAKAVWSLSPWQERQRLRERQKIVW
jgi:hypothetical protein